MRKRFLVISGLPGSGKTTLGRRLSIALGLPLVDKDDILERLFSERGVGDALWRRTLSRESDSILQREASQSRGAIVVSFWHVAGMPADSGTPTDWLSTLPGSVLHLRCVCPPEMAARRFIQRRRHPGHLDGRTSYADALASLRDIEALGRLDLAPCIDVDTAVQLQLDEVVRLVDSRLQCE
jgi:hypothetical protein